MLQIIDKPNVKICISSKYNYIFRKSDGFFIEYGSTREEDPLYAPFPNIADIEISKVIDDTAIEKYRHDDRWIITKGKCGGIGCGQWCYKQNGQYNNTLHISLKGFKELAHKLPDGLCQIAFGVTTIHHHPEIWKIFKECRDKGLAANVTVNGGNVTSCDIQNLAENCNAVAVSVNKTNKQAAYNTLQELISLSKRPDKLLSQVNIHYVLSYETFEECKKVIRECTTDIRLTGLNALVLLMFKNKSTNTLTTITDPVKYKELIDYAQKLGVPLGFDSCSAYNYLKAIREDKDYNQKAQFVTPCCAGRFSAYFDVFGNYNVCSFLEDREEWGDGISMWNVKDFIKEVWNNSRVVKFRKYNIERSKKLCNPCKYFD